ncbi:hypothetical protein BCR36DRAFT_244451, partial [Piromyces finnis]
NVNSNEIVDSQKTLFESSLKNDNVSMLSNEFQLPPSKLHKIISFLNKLNAFWGFDIFKEHQIAYSTNQIITTNGFAEKINDLLKNKFLKNGVVNRCDIIEAVGGQLTLDKLLYYKLKNINLTDSNKLDIYIQQQILLHNKNGNDKILPTKNKNNFYIKKRKIDDNSDDLTKWISPYFFNYCSDQENNDYEDILNNNKDSIVNYKIQLKVNKVLKPIIDQIYNKHQILSKYIPYSSLN